MTRPSSTSTIESPCVRNCCLDTDDVCMGCGRSLEEIVQWQRASNAEREATLIRAAQRCEEKRNARYRS